MDMATQTLRWFHKVADGVTVTVVSDLESTTQPGVSHALARLEVQVGTPLLRTLRPHAADDPRRRGLQASRRRPAARAGRRAGRRPRDGSVALTNDTGPGTLSSQGARDPVATQANLAELRADLPTRHPNQHATQRRRPPPAGCTHPHNLGRARSRRTPGASARGRGRDTARPPRGTTNRARVPVGQPRSGGRTDRGSPFGDSPRPVPGRSASP